MKISSKVLPLLLFVSCAYGGVYLSHIDPYGNLHWWTLLTGFFSFIGMLVGAFWFVIAL